jgi:hypothetical protein
MRPLAVFAVFPAAVSSLQAAPPNDNFASRISISGSSVTGSNVDATEEAGENTRSEMFLATVWWSWQAPASEWVRVDTAGSPFDTVLQISTGTTVAGQTVVAYNDQFPGSNGTGPTSSVTFMATAGTVYNIAVGGWNFFGAETGDITVHITRGTAAMPAYFPSSLTFSPASADVTSAPAEVTASFVIQAKGGPATGVAGVGWGWENLGGDGEFRGLPAFWNTGLPQSGSPQTAFTVHRYTAGGDHIVWFKIIPDDFSPPLIFSGPDGGSGYALPAPPAASQTFTIVNTGPVDTTPPELTAFTIPASADVTTAPAVLPVSAILTDAPAGVTAVKVSLLSPGAVAPLVTTLTRSAGTAQSGMWTGSVAVPKLYPADNYAVSIAIEDDAGNANTYGEGGIFEIPDGDIAVAILGGGAYERWAYTSWFAPADANPGVLDDADGDGRPNLISYAFDLNPRGASGGSGSLPAVDLTGTGASRHLRLNFLRRKGETNSGVTYSAQFTSDPTGVWQSVPGGTVTSVDSTWERVVIEDTVNVTTEPRRFGRVKVEYSPQ